MHTDIINIQPNVWTNIELTHDDIYVIENVTKNTTIYYAWADEKPTHNIGHTLNFGEKINKYLSISDNTCWFMNHTNHRIILAMTIGQ